MRKECVLYDRECINCGECNICDLDPKKVCDSCGKCIDSGNDYNIMDVDLAVEDESIPNNYHYDGEEASYDDEEFFDEDFEEDFDDAFDDAFDDFGEDYHTEEDDDNLEFDFGEFFGQR